jgi:hypothetical protein
VLGALELSSRTRASSSLTGFRLSKPQHGHRVVLDLMIHDLEIILHLVRSPLQSIDA